MGNLQVESWLPVFSGFCDTVFEPFVEGEIEYFQEFRDEKGLKGEVDYYKNIEFNYDDYFHQCTN